MKFAVLRGLLFGAIATPCFFLLVEIIVVCDGGRWLDFAPVSLGVAAMWGFGCAGLGYATHPSAKPVPIPKIVEYWLVPRFFFGASVGSCAAWLLAATGILVGGMLGVHERQPLVLRNNGVEFAGAFAVIATSAAAFAASLMGAMLAPSACEAKDLIKRAAWTAIFGAIGGAWIGTGAGLVVLNLAQWKREYEPTEDIAAWLAIGVGLAAGVAAAIVLRMWRNR
jgi:hypothetical protein